MISVPYRPAAQGLLYCNPWNSIPYILMHLACHWKYVYIYLCSGLNSVQNAKQKELSHYYKPTINRRESTNRMLKTGVGGGWSLYVLMFISAEQILICFSGMDIGSVRGWCGSSRSFRNQKSRNQYSADSQCSVVRNYLCPHSLRVSLSLSYERRERMIREDSGLSKVWANCYIDLLLLYTRYDQQENKIDVVETFKSSFGTLFIVN